MSSSNFKRKILTLEERVKVIRKLDRNESCRKIAKSINCGKTQIQKIFKDRELILKEWGSGRNSKTKYLRKRYSPYGKINELLWEWFCEARSRNVPITGRLLQEKALLLSLNCDSDYFLASNGWLEAWQKRYNVKLCVLSGETADVTPATIDDWTKRVPEIIAGFQPADIFNADETGLYFRAMPTSSLVATGQDQHGTNIAKERITVLLACSATGEKLKPLVIGKSSNPWCFRGKKAFLPVTYKNNRKAWMTSEIFKEWLENVNNKMKNESRKILLFLDKCSAHTDVQLSNVKIMFLPPNTISCLQPLDAGIIQAVKSHYRKTLLQRVLFSMEECQSPANAAKQVTVLDAILLFDSAWKLIPPSTITKCFQKCSFVLPSCDEDQSINISCDDELVLLQPLLSEVSFDEYSACDESLQTSENLGDDWERIIMSKAQDTLTQEECDDDDDDDEEEESLIPTVISTQVARKHAMELKDYAVHQNNLKLLSQIINVFNTLQDIE